ncbi:MAG: dockerin type I repeat-containing protein [Ruminococcus sp.]|nr:dockerin type I repeat-containing protein [Ruminococcus sp.]
MLKKKIIVKIISFIIAATVVSTTVSFDTFAEWKQIGCIGDINNDRKANIADLILLSKHLLAQNALTNQNSYYVGNSNVKINDEENSNVNDYFQTADINQDGTIDAFDLVFLRRIIINGGSSSDVYKWEDDISLKEKLNVDKDTFEYDYVEGIKNFIADHYEKNMGYSVSKDCVISYNADRTVPGTFTGRDPVDIYLTTSHDSYWCKIVFQLSHEMTHYLVAEYRPDSDGYISWLEETICEAMSLYFLDVFYAEYENTELYSENSDYAKYFREYREEEMEAEMEKVTGLEYSLSTANLNALKIINETGMTHREYRTSEMHMLYSYITPKNIEGLLKYRNFSDMETLTLNTVAYRAAYPNNEAVDYICSVCEGIIKNTNK